jgi:hypothetical protein
MTCARIIILKEKGLHNQEVAKKLGNVNHTTVGHIYKDYLRGHNIFAPKHSSGCHRKISTHNANWASLLMAQGLSNTAADIQ